MIYLDWVMSVIVLCVYPIAALPVAALSTKLRRVAKQTQQELGGMTSLLTEKLSGARLIKSFRLEGYAADRLNKSFEHVYKLRMKAVKNRAAHRPAAGSARRHRHRRRHRARLLAHRQRHLDRRRLHGLHHRAADGLAAHSRARQPVGPHQRGPRRRRELLRSHRREAADRRPAGRQAAGASPTAAIRFENVGFAYDRGGVQAITGFTLDVPGGQTVALVGRSGAGKSTVLNLVPRLFDVDQGRITHRRAGHPRRDAGFAARRHLHRLAGRHAVR